jgi:hypothetical protein
VQEGLERPMIPQIGTVAIAQGLRVVIPLATSTQVALVH